ncbi:phosphoesterase [Lutibaculum baratangense AMV1]|uniref:Phosphoesterase n=2 Tax=Lutibaculum TaxID=1358438 RepID=V4RJW8_9HYPH|nr:phosphoesterase [Lutibaculum baratangense AMV1]
MSYDDSVRGFFYWVTRYGKADWFLWPLGLTLLAILIASGFEWPLKVRAALHHWGARIAFIIAAVAIPGLATSLLKLVVGRARPGVEGSHGILDVTTFALGADFQSFPSGHTTNAITLAVALTVLWPRYWAFFLSFPIIIGTSRVMVLDHYPSDVMGGWLLGAVGVLWIRNWCARRKLVFRPCPGGRVVRRRLPHVESATWPALRDTAQSLLTAAAAMPQSRPRD